jgi:hypothetical protein
VIKPKVRRKNTSVRTMYTRSLIFPPVREFAILVYLNVGQNGGKKDAKRVKKVSRKVIAMWKHSGTVP